MKATLRFKDWKETDIGNWVEKVEYLQCNLELWALRPFSNAPGCLIIVMKRFPAKLIRPIVQWLTKAVSEQPDSGGSFWQRVFYSLKINRRLAACPTVSCSTEAEMCLTCRMVLFIQLRFQTGSVLIFGRLWRVCVLSNAFIIGLDATTFQEAIRQLSIELFVPLRVWKARWWLENVPLRLFNIDWVTRH